MRLLQQPVLIVQAPPAFRQQYVGPPDVNEAHERPDAQQFGALAPDVHDAPSPIEHTAGAWHVPLWHVRLLQHPVLIVQAPPVFRQQYVGPPDVNEAHERPDAQQSGALAPDVHDAPSPIEQTAGAWHVPLWHVRLLQHPVLKVHAPPALRQQYVGPPDVNEAHERPDAQQFGPVAPAVHATPSPRPHGGGGGWHVPP